MKWRPYSKYKSSGVEWLGDVPEGWEVKRGRFCIHVNPRSDKLRKLDLDDEVSFVPMEAIGEYGGLELGQTRSIADIASGYTEFDDGDIIVAKITPCFENGKGALAVGLKNGAAFGTTEIHTLRALQGFENRLLFYLTISSPFRSQGEGSMYGAGGQKRVPPDFCKDFRIPLPPLSEQTTIADFLDRETEKIDTLVAKKQNLIERLKEKRTALISQTVTRGLPPDEARKAGFDPHPKLKPSGVEWLGDVPERWDIVQLRRFLRFVTSGSRGWAEHYTEDGAVFVRIGNLTRSSVKIDLSNVQHVTPPAGTEGERTRIVAGDLLLSITAYIGSVAVTDESLEVAYVSQHIALLRFDAGRLEPKFVAYAILTDFGQAQLNGQGYGGTKIQLALDDVKGFWLPVPPLPEQTAIADFLDRETAKIDRLIAKIETAIERLREYRTALITAAVTGKIDVRNLAS